MSNSLALNFDYKDNVIMNNLPYKSVISGHLEGTIF